MKIIQKPFSYYFLYFVDAQTGSIKDVREKLEIFDPNFKVFYVFDVFYTCKTDHCPYTRTSLKDAASAFANKTFRHIFSAQKEG